MFANTTISFSNLVGPTEKIELCGHPVVFIAPSVYGVPQVSHPRSYVEKPSILNQNFTFIKLNSSTKQSTMQGHWYSALSNISTLVRMNYKKKLGKLIRFTRTNKKTRIRTQNTKKHICFVSLYFVVHLYPKWWMHLGGTTMYTIRRNKFELKSTQNKVCALTPLANRDMK